MGGLRRAREARQAREAISRRRRFENLLDRHEVRLRRVDDVLQEAFLEAYRHLPDTFADDRHESA